MIDARFEKFWPRLQKYEGGDTVVNDTADPGGLTKWGISQRAYPELDIANLSEEKAKIVFYDDYYTPLFIAGIMDDRLSWQIFDFGVNAGINRAALTIQKIVKVVPDGSIGNRTLDKINTWEDEYPLWVHFMSERLKYYLMLTERKPVLIKFLKGWIFRTMEI